MDALGEKLFSRSRFSANENGGVALSGLLGTVHYPDKVLALPDYHVKAIGLDLLFLVSSGSCVSSWNLRMVWDSF